MSQASKQVVRSLIHKHGYDRTELAGRLSVSSATVRRWEDGSTNPRPTLEATLRQMLIEVELADRASAAHSDRLAAQAGVDRALRELREALHRRGRLSSRNEALDEVGRLLFAHTMDVSRGGTGISSDLVQRYGGGNPADGLREFVAEMAADNLPSTLRGNISPRDFNLSLKSEEVDLARDIIAAFGYLTSGESAAHRLGGAGVDVVNEAFGRFIADSFIDEKELGQYLTPPEVVEFMVDLYLAGLSNEERSQLADPAQWSDFGSVIDPSCGVSSFLTHFLRSAHHQVAGDDEDWIRRAAGELVVGIDKSERMIRLSLSNLAIFGAATANLHCGNALARSGHEGALNDGYVSKAALILTNPPFGASFEIEDLKAFRLARAVGKGSKSIDSELLFMERYVDWLRPGGQLLAVIPDSILTNKGVFEQLRRSLESEVEILNVVSLPSVTFASAGTTTKTSVLHLRKLDDEHNPARTTRFAVCTDIGYKVRTRGNQRTKYHDSNSQLPLLLEQLTQGRGHDIAEAQLTNARRWDASFHLSAWRRNDGSTEGSGRVPIRNVAELVSDRTNPMRLARKTFPYIEISGIDGASFTVDSKDVLCLEAPSRARQIVRAGDVLVSTVRPERRTIGVVPKWLDGAISTTGVAVLRPISIDPYVLAALISSDYVTEQLCGQDMGIAYPTIEPDCLLDTMLPVNPGLLAKVSEHAVKVQEATLSLRTARAAFDEALAATLTGAC